jgi:hypothetical protein
VALAPAERPEVARTGTQVLMFVGVARDVRQLYVYDDIARSRNCWR